jgi:hypothetical protein
MNQNLLVLCSEVTEQLFIVCQVCGLEIENTNALPPCKCKICLDCMYEWTKEKCRDVLNSDEEFIRCPNFQCKMNISLVLLYQNLSKDKIESISDILTFKYLCKNKDIQKCPKSDCTYAGYLDANTYCRKAIVCEICNTEWKLQNYKEMNFIFQFFLFIKNYIMIEITENIIDMYNKTCLHCKMRVSKTEGCNHMKCSCKKEFCYNCLRDWTLHGSFTSYCNYNLSIKDFIPFIFTLIYIFKTILSYDFLENNFILHFRIYLP